MQLCVTALHCSSSLSCRDEYLAIDNGGYLCANTVRAALIAAWLDASQIIRIVVQLDRSASEYSVKHFDNPED